ncbi:MAG: S41 family peptidase [Bacteroides sp.]|nr:S41 family peptidase [Bacteroides sp.]
MKRVPESSSLLLLITALLFLSSCFQDRRKEFEEETGANRWIYEVMEDHYFWTEDMPSRSKLNLFASQPEFFSSILVSADKYSTIEEVTYSPRTLYSRSNYGFEYAVYSSPYIARVLYVLPGSQASLKGLKRGDWISAVNGTEFTESNYASLIEEATGEIHLTLTTYDENSEPDEDTRTITLSRETIEDNPFLFYTIYTVENRKIGYLVYNKFATGPEDTGNETAYFQEMQRIFAQFQGVDELILDLRYNPGGYIHCAQELASLIVPQNHLEEVFISLKYNINNPGQTDYRFLPLAGNLNLSDLYVITTSATASASEAVIYGLRPYMNVTVVGATTEGKNIGSQAFTNDEYPKWILHPITCQVYNSRGESDYSSGITADHGITDTSDLIWYDLGDPEEKLLNYTIHQVILSSTDDGSDEDEDDQENEGDKNETETTGLFRSRTPTFNKKLTPVYESFKKKGFQGMKIKEPESR